MRRSTLLVLVVAALGCIGGLVLAAATDGRATATAPGVPNNLVVGELAGGQTACQRPVRVATRFDAIEAWLSPGRRVEVRVRAAATGRLLAVRHVVTASTSSGLTTFRLARNIGGTVPLAVCVTNDSRRQLQLEGGAPTDSSGRMSIDGRPTQSALAVLFLRPNPQPLLSLLPSVFHRASLLKLSWLGPWAIWVLAAALLGAFGLAGFAVVQAERADRASSTSDQ